MGTLMLPLEAKTTGNVVADGSAKLVPAGVMMLEMVSGQRPWLITCRVRSDCVPAHTLPKAPLLAMLALIIGAGTLPVTGIFCVALFGSLLETRMFPDGLW